MITDCTIIDLNELHKKARDGKFYGETIIKWEAGEPVFVEVHQKLKPKDFGRLIFIQVI